MIGDMSIPHGKSDLVRLLSAIPAGYVVTHAALARHLGLQSNVVAHILATLDDSERAACPWWRVVADGGAIGRHIRRDDQIARLKADGVPLSGVGIVQELTDRRVSDPAQPPAMPFPHPVMEGGPKPARSRGMKSHG